MKSADELFSEGMEHVRLSAHVDYRSEVVSDLQQAIANFDQALALQSGHADARIQKGYALSRLERHAEAAAVLAEALRLKPDDIDLRLNHAHACSLAEQHAEAVDSFNVVLRHRPRDVVILFHRARSLEALGRFEEALAAWDAVFEDPEQRPGLSEGLGGTRRLIEALFRRAMIVDGMGRNAEALSYFRAAISECGDKLFGISPNQPFLDALHESEAARTACREYFKNRQNTAATWRCAGQTWLSAGRHSEALDAWETMIRLAPSDADAWAGKAEALVQAQRREDALKAYMRSLAIRPRHLGVLARARMVLKELGLPEETLGPGVAS